jgi:hypothetical protein
MHIVLLIIVIGVVLVVAVLHHFLSGQPEDTFKRVPLTWVADVEEGQPCVLVGELHALPDQQLVIAPICGREVLFHLTTLKQTDPKEERGFREHVEQRRGVETVRLEDGSGTALVRLCSSDNPRGIYLKAPEREIRGLSMTQVGRFLESEGMELSDLGLGSQGESAELPPDYFVTQRVIAEGDQVVVVGRACREPEPAAKGTGQQSMTISAPKGRMLYLSNDEKVIADFAREWMASQDAPAGSNRKDLR